MPAVEAGELALVGRRSFPLSFRHVAPAVHVTDILFILLISIVSGSMYRLASSDVLGELQQFFATGALVATMMVAANITRGSSQHEQLLKVRDQIKGIVLVWLFACFLVLGLAFAWKVSSVFSRGAYISFFVVGLVGMIGNRLLWSRLIHVAMDMAWLKPRRAAVMFSAEQSRDAIANELNNLRRHGLMPLWQIAVPAKAEAGAGEPAFSLPDMLRGTNVDEIIILSDWSSAPDLINREQLSLLPVSVRFLPLGAARLLCDRPREQFGSSVLFELQRGALSGAERAAKATFDRVVAAVALLFLVPVFAVVAQLIKIESDGPVFFRQTRRGFNGRPFEILKFRTMRVTENGAIIRQAVIGDERVTKVGGFLRRFSVDELPQLINVLRGEMSIVGPRPHALAHDDHYDRLIDGYLRRQHVRPGMTGWAQIQGARGETPTIEHMTRRVELDLWYVQNWSFWRDVWIILCTVWHVLTARNAY
jgi:Undecaprenyl-phosphate glucose phosphotransferase